MSGSIETAGNGGNGRALPGFWVFVVPVSLRSCKRAMRTIDTTGIVVRPWEPVRGQA